MKRRTERGGRGTRRQYFFFIARPRTPTRSDIETITHSMERRTTHDSSPSSPVPSLRSLVSISNPLRSLVLRPTQQAAVSQYDEQQSQPTHVDTRNVLDIERSVPERVVLRGRRENEVSFERERESRGIEDSIYFGLELIPVHQIEMGVVFLEEGFDEGVADAGKRRSEDGDTSQRQSRRVLTLCSPSYYT